MNKQEGIKELESHKMKSKDIRACCYNDGINAGITVMKKLDEPQKPVVPQFVADWFEENKDNLDNAIFGYLVFWEERDTDSVLYQWFAKSKNKPIETLVRMKDGYEVEKEPLYYVYFPEIIASPEMFFPDIEGAYLMKSDDGIELADNNDFEDMKFTEREIKAIDERYWAFAVPVEQEEAE